MVQAGNANRRDNPYDRKIRPMQTYPVQANGLSVFGNFGVFACTDICLKILLILQTVSVSVILPLSLTSCKTWSAIFNNKIKIAQLDQFVKSPDHGNRGKSTLPAKSTEWNLLRSWLMNGPGSADLAAGKNFFGKKAPRKTADRAGERCGPRTAN